MSQDKCTLPFSQFLLRPDGVVAPCCYNQSYEICNGKDLSFDQIWNHPRLQALRKEFLDGKPTSCKEQIDILGCNKYWSRYENQIDWTALQTKPPVRLDVRLNGLCNIQCIMCGVWKEPNQQYDKSFLWNEGPTRIFPFLKKIIILGGEPFIQKDTFRLIDMITAVNPECEFTIFTNGQWSWSKKVQESMDKVKNLAINISVDAIEKEAYEFVRHKASFEKLLSNLKHWKAYRVLRNENAPLLLTVSFVVSKLNWKEIPKLYEWAVIQNIAPDFQFLENPEELSLASLDIPEKQLVLESLNLWSLQAAGLNSVDWEKALFKKA